MPATCHYRHFYYYEASQHHTSKQRYSFVSFVPSHKLLTSQGHKIPPRAIMADAELVFSNCALYGGQQWFCSGWRDEVTCIHIQAWFVHIWTRAFGREIKTGSDTCWAGHTIWSVFWESEILFMVSLHLLWLFYVTLLTLACFKAENDLWFLMICVRSPLEFEIKHTSHLDCADNLLISANSNLKY